MLRPLQDCLIKSSGYAHAGTIYLSQDFASGPLSFVEFDPETPGREQNREDVGARVFWCSGYTSSAGKLWESLRWPARTRWWSQIAGRGPVAASPCTATTYAEVAAHRSWRSGGR